MNRLTEVGATSSFRDVTGASFDPAHATSAGHYEECFGDFDGDCDLDIYGVNWAASSASFTDRALRDTGAGLFGEFLPIPGSNSDDNSADPVDYDLDGDLDVYVSNFSGSERVARYDGGWAFSAPSGVLPVDSTLTLDSDFADVDQDGDHDVFDANGLTLAEWYRENTTTAVDTTAPRIAHLEQAPARVANAIPTRVRCHVYDNTQLRITQWFAGELELRLDGSPIANVPLRSSLAQVFRAEIPGHLIGLVEHRARVTDDHGNVGTSAWQSFPSYDAGVAFCAGDGTGTPCPCGNDASTGRGRGNSLGAGARLEPSGFASVTSDTFVLLVSPVPNSSVLFFQGTTQVNGGAGSTFGDGLRCAGGSVFRLGTKTAVANGASYPEAGDQAVSVRGALPPSGGVRTYQAWYRNAAAYCTPATFNLSNGWQVGWLP